MSDTIAPNQTVTCTITSVPGSLAGRKTLSRLMRMEPEIQRGLKRLAVRRRRFDNNPHPRGGRIWVARKRATKLVKVEVGEQFTLHVTPQIVPDLRSVGKHIEVKAA